MSPDPSKQETNFEEAFPIPWDDITARVAQSDIRQSPVDGAACYEELFDAISRALHRREQGHVLLVGAKGVGQQAILVELARRCLLGTPPLLANRHVVKVDCKYTAPEESRVMLTLLLRRLLAEPRTILCIEGFERLLRGEFGRSNKPLLFSALSQMEGRLVGLVSPQQYEELLADDMEIQEFFVRADIAEPDAETALALVNRYAQGLGRQYEIPIQPEAVRQAVTLSANYIFHEALPGKAVRVLKQVCEGIAYERTQLGRQHNEITPDHVIGELTKITGVPGETLRGIAERRDYEATLGASIVGQSHAVGEVAAELGLIKAGLTDIDKPASVMMFVGQTGTGKTEMAKALARIYSTSKRLRTYTLGNFVESHSVSGIIGVPSGYVGHDAGGSLINDLNADPYGVFLLDEADKAHPDVLQPLLNLFDEGWIVDQRGVKASASRAIFVLTTNVGQRMIADMAKKGNTPEEIADRMKETLAQIKHGKANRPVFSPEFLARLKRIIVFGPLSAEAMQGICELLIARMQTEWLANRQKKLVIPPELIRHIGDEAHQRNEKSQGKEGGRIVRKLIVNLIETPLQKAISYSPGEYRKCSHVAIEWSKAESPAKIIFQ